MATSRLLIATAIAMSSVSALAIGPQTSEDRDLIQLSQRLRPITDQEWGAIAGPQISNRYEVISGDTLWDISKRLFGNSYYWPKVWALNSRIGNPHIINPGQSLQFTPATLESMPSLDIAPDSGGAVQPLANDENAPISPTSEVRYSYDEEVNLTAQKYLKPRKTGPKEFMKLPADRWAPADYISSAQKDYDEYGLDRELKVLIPRRFVSRVPAIANDRQIPFLGEVVASRRDGIGLSEKETVFLRSPGQDLQVGSSYSILSEPEFIRERRSDRLAYIYQTIGEVRIIGIKDGLYIATVNRAYDVIKRGAKVYPLLPLITDIKPTASRIALEALVITSHVNTVQSTAQFRVVHFDRGIEDGVQVGNVFRMYTYDDPITGQKITESDFLMNADALVVHATAQFSTAVVLRSRDLFARGDFGVTLTDVSDLEKQFVDRTKSIDGLETSDQIDRELDELDELDRNSGEGLGEKEEIEIKQLDHWDSTRETIQPQETAPSDESPAIDPTQLDSNDEEPTLPMESSFDDSSPDNGAPDDAQLDEGTLPTVVEPMEPTGP